MNLMYSDWLKTKTESLIIFLLSFLIFLNSASYFVPLELRYIFLAIFFANVLYWSLCGGVKSALINFSGAACLLAFCVLLYFNLFYSNAQSYGAQKLAVFAIYSLLYVISSGVIVRGFAFFLKTSLFLGTVFIILLIWKFQDPISFLNEMAIQKVRLGLDADVNEEVINPIWLARYMGFIIILVLSSSTKKIFWKTSKTIFLCLLFLYMLASGSKGPFFALILATFILYSSRSNWLGIIKKWGGIVLVAVTIFFLLGLQNNEFIRDRFLFAGDNASFSARETLIRKILDSSNGLNILFGSGTGNTGFLITGFDIRSYPHNIILEIFVENGLLGIFFLVLMIASVIKHFKFAKYSKLNRLWLALFVYFFGNALVSGDLISSQTTIFAYLCFMASCTVYKKEIYKTRIPDFGSELHGMAKSV